MRYFELETLGDEQDRELVFIEQEPEEFEGAGYRLAEGEPTDDVHPAEARIYLDPYSPGLKLATLLGNSIGYLIVHAAFVELLRRHDVAPVELRPVSIYNQRKRLRSRDYWIVNPLRFVDCVDRTASRIQYASSDPTQIVGIDELVFDSKRLQEAPDLFRIPEQRMGYFISERVVRDLQGRGFDNIYLREIRQQA
ncbi:imm11 family protein [Archangium gephyra]|uniref:imm11 family protein n=1 Tax=Archangium gephyra TaxID=48 RepID=UPI003B81655C